MRKQLRILVLGDVTEELINSFGVRRRPRQRAPVSSIHYYTLSVSTSVAKLLSENVCRRDLLCRRSSATP